MSVYLPHFLQCFAGRVVQMPQQPYILVRVIAEMAHQAMDTLLLNTTHRPRTAQQSPFHPSAQCTQSAQTGPNILYTPAPLAT